MRYLADTHVLLWALEDSPRLSDAHRQALLDPAHSVAFSAVSIAEVWLKVAVGKLVTDVEIAAQLRDDGFEELPFTVEHAGRLRELPLHHRDPFDRMLVAQAQAENLTLLTVDPNIAKYDVRTA
jgi:PIN domain nuclease of toxin-antitoxin system